MAKTKILLSYARNDGSELANQVRNLLQHARQAAWLDTEDLVAGQEWSAQIEERIRQNDAVLLILTAHAAGSVNVRNEIEFANGIQKRVIPLVVGGVPLPEWVRQTHAIAGSPADADVVARLVAAVDAVWEDVLNELRGLDFGIRPEVAPLLTQLQGYCTVRPVRPEVVRVGAEFAQHLNADLNAGRLMNDLVADIIGNSYVNDTWRFAPAFRANSQVVVTVLNQFITSLKLLPVQVVSIVPVVMTAAEAAQLADGTAFDAESQALAQLFQTVRNDLEVRYGVQDWAGRYAARPEEWRPFGDQPLRRLIELEIADRAQRAPNAGLLRAKYVDIRTVNDPANRPELVRLRNERCIVIIDHVSVCHPRLFNEYRRSLLDVFPQTVLMKVAPFEPVPLVDAELAVPFRQRFDSFFYERLKLDRDRGCGRAGTDFDLRSWLGQQFAGFGAVAGKASDVLTSYP